MDKLEMIVDEISYLRTIKDKVGHFGVYGSINERIKQLEERRENEYWSIKSFMSKRWNFIY